MDDPDKDYPDAGWAGMTPDPRDCALIGHTGFVGSNLAVPGRFVHTYNSTSIDSMAGREFDLVVCCGLPGVKWMANKEPQRDAEHIARLSRVLAHVRARRFVLVSTVDVYPTPVDVDETTDLSSLPNHAYGRHRLEFEWHARELFDNVMTLRLPALFGQGLRKNMLYDLLHDNALSAINPASSFQWYDLERLWSDMGRAATAGLELVNMAVEPVPSHIIIDRLFPQHSGLSSPLPGARYDVGSIHAQAFGGRDGYMVDAGQSLDAMQAWLARERLRLGGAGQVRESHP